MSSTVFIAVIFAAVLHSVWNGMVKKQDDKYIALVAIVLGHVPLSIIVLFFTPIISIESIPYIFISAIFIKCDKGKPCHGITIDQASTQRNL